MPRTVRISPVPIPPPPVAPRVRRSAQVPVGVAAVLVALVAGLGWLLLSGSGEHSYDRHAVPPAAVQLTAGAPYLLSTRDGPGVLPGAAALTCTYVQPDGAGGDLPVTATAADSRATHAVASFVAPVSGTVTVACTGGSVGSRAVFVDDADDAGTDFAGILLVVAGLAGIAGTGLLLGALYARTARPVPGQDASAQVSGVTGDPTP